MVETLKSMFKSGYQKTTFGAMYIDQQQICKCFSTEIGTKASTPELCSSCFTVYSRESIAVDDVGAVDIVTRILDKSISHVPRALVRVVKTLGVIHERVTRSLATLVRAFVTLTESYNQDHLQAKHFGSRR